MTQSSTYGDRTADRAIDGNTSGKSNDNSYAQTINKTQDWLEIDLGAPAYINEIDLFTRYDWGHWMLRKFYVMISDQPFTSDDPDVAKNEASWYTYHSGQAERYDGEKIDVGGQYGRYVRIQLTENYYLQLAEVQVFGTALTNLALNGEAEQSSTYGDRTAQRAIDGNNSGKSNDNSYAQTITKNQDWLEIDLGSTAKINEIDLYTRYDWGDWMLRNFYVMISDQPFSSNDPEVAKNEGSWYYYHNGQAERYDGEKIAVGNQVGRYIRIQLTENYYLQLAEVEVYGFR
ncbi:MAG: discoidin domain-containing protein [Algicola sp.]|nr:discoidin domain-containing protein [Algicola sp.]